MPVYALRCPGCQLRFEKVELNAAARYEICCPTCGTSPCDTDWDQTRIRDADRRFHGTEGTSLRFGFHPSEVAEARRIFGDACEITDGGDVNFHSRGGSNQFLKTVEKLRATTRDEEQREEAARAKLKASGAADDPKAKSVTVSV